MGLGKVEPRRQKVKASLDFPEPNNRKQLRSFLGLAGYYRMYIPHYAKLSAALSNFFKKGTKFSWTKTMLVAYLDIKSDWLVDQYL